jgi:glutamate-5-semialdehyde dehydrogenase
MALAIAVNAKTQRYGTCNTMETLLVHAARPRRCCRAWRPLRERTAWSCAAASGRCACCPAAMAAATEADWATEYLAPILAMRVVDDIDQAMAHISRYGSGTRRRS